MDFATVKTSIYDETQLSEGKQVNYGHLEPQKGPTINTLLGCNFSEGLLNICKILYSLL